MQLIIRPTSLSYIKARSLRPADGDPLGAAAATVVSTRFAPAILGSAPTFTSGRDDQLIAIGTGFHQIEAAATGQDVD